MEQSDQIPDQISASTFLEKVLSRRCKLHQQFKCEYIHLKPSEYSPRLCFQCMEDRGIPLNEAISISLLIQSSYNTLFRAYPMFTDSTIIQKVENFKFTQDKISSELEQFYQNFRSRVNYVIETTMAIQKQKVDCLSASYQEIQDSLAQISQIKQFQTILKQENDNDQQLKAFINDQYTNSDNNTQIIRNKLLNYQKIHDSFSLTQPNSQLKKIENLIEGIQFFSETAQNEINNEEQEQQLQQAQQQIQLQQSDDNQHQQQLQQEDTSQKLQQSLLRSNYDQYVVYFKQYKELLEKEFQQKQMQQKEIQEQERKAKLEKQEKEAQERQQKAMQERLEYIKKYEQEKQEMQVEATQGRQERQERFKQKKLNQEQMLKMATQATLQQQQEEWVKLEQEQEQLEQELKQEQERQEKEELERDAQQQKRLEERENSRLESEQKEYESDKKMATYRLQLEEMKERSARKFMNEKLQHLEKFNADTFEKWMAFKEQDRKKLLMQFKCKLGIYE